MKLKAKISNNLSDFITTQNLFALKALHEGVVHIGFPQQIETNINKIKTVFEEHDLDLKLYLAHKATKNIAFIKESYKMGIDIDVASKNELISALSCGFQGDRIECTGPKNNDFLQLALCQGCTINLDSIQELGRLIVIYNCLGLTNPVKVLVRINDPIVSGRTVMIKSSRFGSNVGKLEKFYQLFEDNSFLQFQGFHFHAYGYDPTMRGEILEYLNELTMEAFSKSFEPNTINIGGAFLEPNLENYQDWSSYLDELEKDLLIPGNIKTSTYQNYGLYINEKGKIGGKDKAMSKFYQSCITNDLEQIINTKSGDRALSSILGENMINFAIEPGRSLLNQCGISIIKIIEIKKLSDGRNAVVVEANLYNLSLANMLQCIADPILIQKNPAIAINTNKSDKFFALVAGNLCREDDFLIDREVEFDAVPEAGDLLVFVNTAGYYAGFEDGSPIMHPTSKDLVAFQKNQQWQITTPHNYNPYDL